VTKSNFHRYNYNAPTESSSSSLSGIMLDVGEVVNGVKEDTVVSATCDISTICLKLFIKWKKNITHYFQVGVEGPE
jgi:hypothetical protein